MTNTRFLWALFVVGYATLKIATNPIHIEFHPENIPWVGLAWVAAVLALISLINWWYPAKNNDSVTPDDIDNYLESCG